MKIIKFVFVVIIGLVASAFIDKQEIKPEQKSSQLVGAWETAAG